MIFRLSQKLAKNLKIPVPRPAPADSNPFADWSSHLFIADRSHYLILTNTPSLYSTVIDGRNISHGRQFIDRALGAIREFMVADRQEFIYRNLIAPALGTVRFASALNRSVLGSMNNQICQAQFWLTEGELSPFDTSFKLNDMPMSYLRYGKPREAFRALDAEQIGLASSYTSTKK